MEAVWWGDHVRAMTRNLFETERLTLRPPTRKDAGAVADLLSRNRDYFGVWESDREESYFTKDGQTALMLRAIAGWDSGTRYYFLIERKSDNVLIGTIHITSVLRGAFQSCRLGYKMDREAAGNGYMTEAMKPAIDFMFREQGLHRIIANVMPNNKGSRRVLDKLGFEREGLARKYMKVGGQWEDHICMVLINE